MTLTRIVIIVLAAASLAVSACGGGGSETPSPPAPPTALDVFDAVWKDFDATYSFFVLKGIDWDDARVRFRPQLTASSNDEQLFDVLSAMLLELEDGPNHNDFGPFLDSFISPGGTESFSGPVAVLTNRRTFSSAESLLLAFKTLPNFVTFGDFTGGGSANPAQRTLSNGWTYTVSQWIEFKTDGTTFEGVGIEPDVRVDIDSTDAAALRDTIIDVAIADLRDRMAP